MPLNAFQNTLPSVKIFARCLLRMAIFLHPDLLPGSIEKVIFIKCWLPIGVGVKRKVVLNNENISFGV